MTKELEKKIKGLKKCLYKNNTELNSIDNVELQKALFHLLRECLKERTYEIEVGSYLININPKELSVKFENTNTTIEISNEDIYFETIRDIETRYFCISQMKKDDYLLETPVIEVSGIVTNIGGVFEEHYMLELLSDTEDNINNYLELPNDMKISSSSYNDNYHIMIKRRINRTDSRTDVSDLFVPNKVVPVYYDALVGKYKTQLEKIHYNPNDYTILLPLLEEKKNIVSYLYSSIVEFYNDYINKNS